MKKFIFSWIINTVSLFVVVNLIPGINVGEWQVGVVFSLVLTTVNIFLKPALVILTLPLNIVSFGLFTFVLNSLIFYFVSKVVRGFTIESFSDAFIGALFLSVMNFIINVFVGSQRAIMSGNKLDNTFRNRKYNDVVEGSVKEEKDRENDNRNI